MMRTVRETKSLRDEIARARKRGMRVGLVPTMGWLHAGHMALVEACRRESDLTVVSIFVNPKQFGPGEDFERYPRNVRRDRRMLAEAGCDVCFVPSVSEMYPRDFKTVVTVEGLSDRMCGVVRPGHFEGVATIVLKLIMVVRPDMAYFGEKDYQQLVLVRRMVQDLAVPVEVRSVPTVRDRDGLAVSSRNKYLSAQERSIATSLYRSLELGRLLVAAGERRSRAIIERMTGLLVDSGITRIDYVSIVDPETLDEVDYLNSGVRLAVAAWVGTTRLIDNLQVDVPGRASKVRRLRRGRVGLVLAAGEGKRMKSDLPKVLHTVGGRPMVEHVVRAARRAGIKDIIIVVGHRSERVERAIKRLGVTAVRQDVQRGTAHAVLQAYPLLVSYKGDLVVLSGDTPLVKAETIRRLMDIHTRHSNVITFATAVLPNARGYGRIIRDRAGCFSMIVEERDADRAVRQIREVNAGLYCLRARPLFDALLSVTADNKQMEYYLPDVIKAMRSRGCRVEAVLIDDHTEVLGVNTAEELEVLRKLFSRRSSVDADNKRGLENAIHRKGR